MKKVHNAIGKVSVKVPIFNVDTELYIGEESIPKALPIDISDMLDIDISRWRNDEDGEFNILRIGSRYFRSTNIDNYSSSIDEIELKDLYNYEQIDI